MAGKKEKESQLKTILQRIARLTLIAGLAVGMFAPTHAFARSGGDEGIPAFTRELSASQQAALKKIWSENAAARKELRKALAAKRAELAEIMKSGKPDKAKIEGLSREIGALRGKMLVEGAEVHARLARAGLPVGEMKLRDRGGRYDSNNLAPRLNSSLTAEQKVKARQILAGNAAARKEVAESITARRAELAELMKASPVDNAKIEAVSAEIGELRGKMLVDRVDLRSRLKKAGLPDNCLERSGNNARERQGKKGAKKSSAESAPANDNN